ncbi:UPF0262 family protein [Pseudoruegeria sp. SK021]|uniref:UPF0262 family protein n=1 Tax=Pseudoruegeria sp. SK021 TaxID=1933035 RepID=UPI000A22649E|nr:UPF0262 family protein [Pseudoruegeria sp. SK021]OSP54060.1 hypothetical protein BV911_14700 [Pseudoruegeria sp. SK021]
MNRLSHVELDVGTAPAPEIDQEQRVAIYDLLDNNHFSLPGGPTGPYRLTLSHDRGKLSFHLTAEASGETSDFSVSLAPLRQVVKDYAQICRSYYEAVKSRPPVEIEALDNARRDIHGEGGRGLIVLMAGKAEIDDETARRLFTLVCALSPAG